tara:strand:- start:928 stop:1923 length:996 start_codon:yes stop_codon:yes gene_type:complete
MPRKSTKRKKKKQGGLLVGPSHEEGGILATTPGMPDVELEGGEYIINAQTVNAVGTEFLDQLNSTQTSYHTGGFGAGQLPSPSNYRKGGKIKKRRGGRVNNKKMRRGGKPQARRSTVKKMYHGGPHNGNRNMGGNGNGEIGGPPPGNGNPVTETFFAPQSPRYYRLNGIIVPIGAPLHRHQDGTVMTEHTMGPNDNSVVVTTQMRRGGKVNNNGRKKMRRGGRPAARRMRRGGRPATRRTMRRGGTPAARRMRRGGNIRRMQEGGMNGCPNGMIMQNGGCVPMGNGGYRTGGRVRRMPHGGPHPGQNPAGTGVYCPQGNYGRDEYGNTICV